MLRGFYSLSFPATVIAAASFAKRQSMEANNLWDDMGNLDDGANRVNFVDNLVDKFH